MTTATIITMTEAGAYTTEARGVEYHLRRDVLGRWEVWSRRKSLGRFNVGTFKFFDTLAEVSANVRAFAGIDVLAEVEAVPA